MLEGLESEKVESRKVESRIVGATCGHPISDIRQLK